MRVVERELKIGLWGWFEYGEVLKGVLVLEGGEELDWWEEGDGRIKRVG